MAQPVRRHAGPEMHGRTVGPPHAHLPRSRERTKKRKRGAPPDAFATFAAQHEELRDVHHVDGARHAGAPPDQSKSDQFPIPSDQVWEVVVSRPPFIAGPDLEAAIGLDAKLYVLAEVVRV